MKYKCMIGLGRFEFDFVLKGNQLMCLLTVQKVQACTSFERSLLKLNNFIRMCVIFTMCVHGNDM